MTATLSLDEKKYARLANRVVIKAIETEEEYDRMVAAVKHLMDKGENRLSREELVLLETFLETGALRPVAGGSAS